MTAAHDLEGTLSAITLEHLNHPDGPQRVTITADGCAYFVRDTITEHHPIYGVHEVRRWLATTRRPATLTPAQMKALSATMQRQGWDEIAMGWHGLPSAGRIQR